MMSASLRDRRCGNGPKPGKLQIPTNAHRLIKRLSEIVNDEMTTLSELAARAGVSNKTICDWRHRTNPKIDDLDAVLNVMDYELVIRKRKAA